MIPEWSRGGSVQEALGQETSGLIKLPQEHYREHLKKFFHTWRNEIEAQMGECSAADRDAFGQVQRTQWSIQNKCLSQPQESCPKSPFDLERAACACSGRTLDPVSKELKWMDGSLMPLCCAALLKEGDLCDECCEAPLSAVWSDDPAASMLTVDDRFDGNFNEQDLCEKILFAEIEEAGGHDPDDVGEHLMAFSHAGEYLAHAITFGEDKLTASVPPRNHGSVKAFCNEFGRDMRNYCAAYDFTMTDSKEFKEQAKCMQNSLGKHKVGLHGFVHCHEDTLIRNRDYPFLSPGKYTDEVLDEDDDGRLNDGEGFDDWYDKNEAEGRFENWAFEGQATLNTGMDYVDPSRPDKGREVHWDTWRNEAEGDSNSGSWMMLFQEKLTTGCGDAYDGAALSMSYGGRDSTIVSNLNGKGPDTSNPEGILFKHVGRYNGKDLDLWVTHINSGSSADFTANTARNTNCVKDKSDRCVDGFAEINIRGNTRAKLTFSFRNSDNFNQAVTLDKFAFTFYDLDKSNTATEYICIENNQYETIEFDKSKIDDDTNRAGVQCNTGARDFVATAYGDVGDNPTSVDSTSRAITMYFEGKSSFDVTLGVMGSSDASRNFRFAPVAPTKPECKEEKVAMCEFGDFGQRAAYQDPDSFEQVPAKNIYARCLCAPQEETVADRQAIHDVYAYEYGFADIQRSHQGCPFPTLAEEMAHTFADDELNWLPDECLWNLEAAGACYEPQFKLTKDGVTADGVKFPGKELTFPSPSDSGTLDDNALLEYNSYRKGRAVISDCGTPMYLTGGTWSTEWHGFPFCDQDGADGASQFSYCVPDHYCGACKSGHTDCNNVCFPEVAAGQDYVPFLGLEDEYLIPNCDCARAEQQEMGSIVMDAAVVENTIVTDVTDPNCKLCKQDPAPNCHAHPNVYILFVPFFQPLHEDSPTQKNQRWFYKNAMLWMAADCCQNYYVEEDPDYEKKVQHVFMYNSILKLWHATKPGYGGIDGKDPANKWQDSYLYDGIGGTPPPCTTERRTSFTTTTPWFSRRRRGGATTTRSAAAAAASTSAPQKTATATSAAATWTANSSMPRESRMGWAR